MHDRREVNTQKIITVRRYEESICYFDLQFRLRSNRKQFRTRVGDLPLEILLKEGDDLLRAEIANRSLSVPANKGLAPGSIIRIVQKDISEGYNILVDGPFTAIDFTIWAVRTPRLSEDSRETGFISSSNELIGFCTLDITNEKVNVERAVVGIS